MTAHEHWNSADCAAIANACEQFVETGRDRVACGDGCCHSEVCGACGELAQWHHEPYAEPARVDPPPYEYEYPPEVASVVRR